MHILLGARLHKMFPAQRHLFSENLREPGEPLVPEKASLPKGTPGSGHSNMTLRYSEPPGGQPEAKTTGSWKSY